MLGIYLSTNLMEGNSMVLLNLKKEPNTWEFYLWNPTTHYVKHVSCLNTRLWLSFISSEDRIWKYKKRRSVCVHVCVCVCTHVCVCVCVWFFKRYSNSFDQIHKYFDTNLFWLLGHQHVLCAMCRVEICPLGHSALNGQTDLCHLGRITRQSFPNEFYIRLDNLGKHLTF